MLKKIIDFDILKYLSGPIGETKVSPIFDNADYMHEIRDLEAITEEENNRIIRRAIYLRASQQAHRISAMNFSFLDKEYGGSIAWISEHLDEVMVAGLKEIAPIEVLAALEIVPPEKENLLE